MRVERITFHKISYSSSNRVGYSHVAVCGLCYSAVRLVWLRGWYERAPGKSASWQIQEGRGCPVKVRNPPQKIYHPGVNRKSDLWMKLCSSDMWGREFLSKIYWRWHWSEEIAGTNRQVQLLYQGQSLILKRRK